MSANLSKMSNSRCSSPLELSKYFPLIGREVVILIHYRSWTQKWIAASWNPERLSKMTTTL
jgi:hypothetical protein